MKIAILYKKCSITNNKILLYLTKIYLSELFYKDGANFSLYYQSSYLKYLRMDAMHLWNTGKSPYEIPTSRQSLIFKKLNIYTLLELKNYT